MTDDVPASAAPDPVIHAPARLAIMTILNEARQADFTYLLGATGLTRGNLATHLSRLEENCYVTVEKGFRGRVPLTRYRITAAGREALQVYRRYLLGAAERIKLDPV